MLAKVYSSAIFGMEAYLVEVEIDISTGLRSFSIVGLPDVAVQESKERVRAAIKNSQLDFPPRRITVNLAPADIKKEGPAFDLPIAIGILTATGQVESSELEKYIILGELSLDGKVRSVSGILPIALSAKHMGKHSFIVPQDNAREAALVTDLNVYPAKTLTEAANLLSGQVGIAPLSIDPAEILKSLDNPDYGVDFSEVKGQEHVKRALEIAIAGAHNVIMIGPPGSGKTMLAKRLPTILPTLSIEEALEVTKLYSISGLLPSDTSLIAQRSFRAPHHTISTAGLTGGGSVPKPGEISLAHNGVLFLDELPEFRRDALEVLRQPLEEGVVTIARAVASVTYPARFMLIAAMNPCPCGYYTDPVKECTCTPYQIQQYRKKISGPLLDRIDIHIEVPRLRREEIMSQANGESSQSIRERIQRAHKTQEARFKNTPISYNAHMRSKEIKQFCQLGEDAKQLLGDAISQLSLSARAHDRILKLSRTIADLEGKEQIELPHIAEAVQYRSLDRKFW